MFKNNFILNLIILLINIQLNCYCAEHPPYQVSIWMKNKLSNNNGTHLCNGAIIHERLILTTSDCMHSKVIGTNIINQLAPTMIIVVAGSINSPSKSLLIVNVTSIDVAKDFNSTTLENDLSILQLNESLPLDTRSDIKWILLDDHHDIRNNSCYINSQNPASPTNVIQQTHPVQIFDNQNCTNSTNYSSPRKNDICSSYVFSSGNICNKTDDDINASNDRGTGLICDSKLIGLLSYIISPNNESACENITKLNAIYTRVSTHLIWIYEKISIASKIDLDKSNHTMSPPYVASAPSPTISNLPPGLNLPEHEHKSTTTTSASPTSSVPQSTTAAEPGPGPGTTTVKSVTSSSTHSTNNQNKPLNKPTSSASSIKLNCFNSMFAITLIFIYFSFHK